MNYLFLGGLSFLLGLYSDIRFFVAMMNLISSFESTIQVISYTIFIYFLGILMSRIGSFIEFLLKRLGSQRFIEYAPYRDFIKAEKEDSKISVLSKQSNVYRSLVAMFIVLILLALGERYFPTKWWNHGSTVWGLGILLVIFYFSWKRQTSYVRKRVENRSAKES